MSPVFGHGRLRLYLLKLLGESPRHGYEVIRLLQDRFLGVYSPSPGTIYPRLARLEQDGLVTHEVVKGKKVYRLTDAGRAELERRMDELAELEEELTESVRDIAREVQEDVRETVRSLREELTQAAREMRRQGPVGAAQNLKETTQRQKEEWQRRRQYWKDQKRTWKQEWRHAWDDVWPTAMGSAEDAARVKLDRALRRFVDDVRAVAQDGVDDDRVRRTRDLLAETCERIRTEVFGLAGNAARPRSTAARPRSTAARPRSTAAGPRSTAAGPAGDDDGGSRSDDGGSGNKDDLPE